jgi:hypothetical protein
MLTVTPSNSPAMAAGAAPTSAMAPAVKPNKLLRIVMLFSSTDLWVVDLRASFFDALRPFIA